MTGNDPATGRRPCPKFATLLRAQGVSNNCSIASSVCLKRQLNGMATAVVVNGAVEVMALAVRVMTLEVMV